jgi:hypothetical protein
MAKSDLSGHERSNTPDPVLFGSDPFAGQLEPEWDSDEPTYSPRPRWPVVATILILVVLMVGAMGIWVF